MPVIFRTLHPMRLVMQHRTPVRLSAWHGLVLLAAVLATTAVRADDYSEVSQLLRTGKLVEAQARVERHLAANPRDPQMRFYRGVIQRESGRSAEALLTFTKLSEDHPELPEPYNNMAVIHASLGQYDKARIALEKALRTHPSYATAHDNLADVYARLASQAYGRALQLDGAAPAPQPKLALLHELVRPTSEAPPPLLAAAPAVPAAPIAKPAVAPAPVQPVVTAAVATPATPSPSSPPLVAKVPPPAAAQPAPPAVPAPTATTATTATSGAVPDSRREVEQAVQAWARAWADKNMPQYLAAYGPDFETPGRVARNAWEEDRRLRITGKSRIAVKLLGLQVTVKGNRAVAKFRQDYKADTLAVLSRKTLELVKAGDRWLIVRESSGG